MLLIKNDPKYNEQWPRALVPYKRIYGVDEPQRLPPLANDGKLVAAPARGDAVRPGRHVQPVQARELSQRRASSRASVTATLRRRRLRPPRLSRGWARSTRRTSTARRSPTGASRAPTPAATRNERHPRHPHPGDGADHRPARSGRRFFSFAPGAAAHPGRDPGAQVRPSRTGQAEASRSTPTAIPTPASSPRSPPTSPSPSRRSTRTAWC